MQVCLFFAWFLPVGEHFSVDSALLLANRIRSVGDPTSPTQKAPKPSASVYFCLVRARSREAHGSYRYVDIKQQIQGSCRVHASECMHPSSPHPNFQLERGQRGHNKLTCRTLPELHGHYHTFESGNIHPHVHTLAHPQSRIYIFIPGYGTIT